jgi:hypothetical protein
MKKTTKLTLVRSLVVLGSCLAFSHVAQAAPRFLGTLRISFDGMIMYMGGTDLGSSSMVMFMTMMGMGNETVTHSDGDFAVLGVRSGALVNGPMTFMEMPMGVTVSIPFVRGWSWTETDTGPTFSSTGPDNLRITFTGMTRGGGYAPTVATLTADFFKDENGFLKNSITLIAEPPGLQISN